MIGYTYIGYPLLLALITIFWRKNINKKSISPSVSIIIAAHNEEKTIKKTLNSVLKLDYPINKREIIVISDHSTDKTNQIVKKYKNVKLIVLPKRKGKTVAQNEAVKKTKGEILVFFDSGTLYKKNVLKELIRNLNDPKIGCVTGNVIIKCNEKNLVSRGFKLYFKYDQFLIQKESKIGSLFQVNGPIYAIRKNLHEKLDERLIRDFVIASKMMKQNARTVYEKEAIAYENPKQTPASDFKMRVRIAIQAYEGMREMVWLLNPFKSKFVAFTFFSHKILRYGSSILIFLLLFLNFLLLKESFYLSIFILQCIFYGFAILGLVFNKIHIKIPLFHIPYYITAGNIAIICGLIKYLGGDRKITWQPRM